MVNIKITVIIKHTCSSDEIANSIIKDLTPLEQATWVSYHLENNPEAVLSVKVEKM